ncbi:hypothetical protein [Chroococcus sp. FPU101]|uniref:hypothetical protein n=1 Tax=Chroococcus sp. FPU101 TaxID=1974212 RepID=UPI001A8E30ED|nr:hypothetical protein [Chroococcus sp. FPU101]GFE69482.1 hypothetical protein CFPU101_20920 [Chroococcus sp. FPU101]
MIKRLCYRIKLKKLEAKIQTTLIATVTPNDNLELPPEIREKVKVGEKFILTLTEDTIT